MAHPLIDLARHLDRRRERHRQRTALHDALADPHLARDLGLPPRVRPLAKSGLW